MLYTRFVKRSIDVWNTFLLFYKARDGKSNNSFVKNYVYGIKGKV